MNLIFRIKITVSGNINGDGQFTVADVVSLQKWILGDKDVEIPNWAQADFNLDGKLDAFDLCLMRCELIKTFE